MHPHFDIAEWRIESRSLDSKPADLLQQK